MKVALYARVSTRGNGQETENQLAQLRKYCLAQGYEIHAEYIDEVSGKSSEGRLEFQRLFRDASRRRFDLVLFWALDRFSREGVLATLKYLEELDGYGVGWKSFTEQYLDSAGVFKDAIIGIMATLAKQERIKISERTIAGMERARAKGKRIGRPKRFWDREKAREMRKEGASLGQIAKRFRVARSTVHRLVREG